MATGTAKEGAVNLKHYTWLIEQHADRFHDEMADDRHPWQLDLSDPASPQLGQEVRELLVEGMRDMLDSFNKAAVLEGERKKKWTDMVKAGPALVLRDKLLEAQQIRDLRFHKDKVVMQLVGATIKRAIDLADAIGIESPAVDSRFFMGDPEQGFRDR